MNKNITRWIPSVIATAVLAALTACGGDSDTPDPVSMASADSVSVPWNTTTALAVTSNDEIANGTASVAVSTPPTHGAAVVSGNSIQYTPTPGWFGTDTLSYALTVGGKTSTATVQIAVAAHITLSGTVRDDPLPDAVVVLTVNGVAQPPVTADADGHYTADITTSTPSAFITLQATGAGAQSNVVLTSLVGDASVVAAVAASDGTVSATSLPSVNVTNVTTAEAVLATQALGGTPASSADIAAAAGQFSSAQTIQMATAIKLVADASVALPNGAANTLALVSNPGAYTAFVTDQATNNAAVFNATKAAVVSDPAIAVAPTVPVAGAADVTMVLTLGQGAGATGVTSLTLKADGTAVMAGAPVVTGTWTTDGTQITVVYDTPQVYPNLYTGSDGYQHDATETDTAFKVRQLGTDTATQTAVGSYVFSDGPQNGQKVTLADNWITDTIVTATQSFHDTDFPVGAEWAGVLTTDFDPNTASYTSQDVLKIVDATHVLYERTGVTGTYAINGGSLVVTTASGSVFSYTRLFTGPKGEERWLTTRLVDGASTWVYDAAVVSVTPGMSFAGIAANDYLSYVNAGLATGQFYIDLLPNGTGSGSNSMGTSGLYTPLGTWTVDESGVETLTRYYCESDPTTGVGFCSDQDKAAYAANGWGAYGQTRSWQLLRVTAGNFYVMERLTNLGQDFDQYRVNVYTYVNSNL